MMETFDGVSPSVAESAFVHPMACVRGDVEIGEHSIVWPGATITGDMGSIRIGRCTIVEDNCAIHAGSYREWLEGRRTPLEIGDHVTIGHGAVVHARRIGEWVLIGMNATVLQNVEIGDRCIIAAGAVVTEGMRVPEGSFVAGVPAVVKGAVTEGQSIWIGGDYHGDDSYYTEFVRKLKESTAGD